VSESLNRSGREPTWLLSCFLRCIRIGSGDGMSSPFIHLWTGLVVESFVHVRNTVSCRYLAKVKRQVDVRNVRVRRWKGNGQGRLPYATPLV